MRMLSTVLLLLVAMAASMGAYADDPDTVTTVINWLATAWGALPEWVHAITLVISAAAAVAAATKTPRGESTAKKLRRIVDWIGLNFGHAKNKEDDGS